MKHKKGFKRRRIMNGEKIVKMYLSKKHSVKEIAKKFGCSIDLIYKRLREMGIPRDIRELRLPEEKICRDYSEYNVSPYVMAKEFGCSIYSIYRVLHRNNVEIKPYGFFNIGKKQSEETKRKRGCYKTTTFSEKTKRILRESNLGKKNPFYKKKHSLGDIEKIRKASIKRWRDEEYKRKVGKKIREGLNKEDVKRKRQKSLKESWNKSARTKEIRIKRLLKSLMKRPTSFEKKISELCIENSLPFVYTGDGRFLINYKNPDFVNKKDKVVIEVFYSYFKIRDYGSVENYKEFCRKKYNPCGWKVIFIDETEIDNKDLCLNKIASRMQ